MNSLRRGRWDAQLAAEFEQVVLDLGQAIGDARRYGLTGQDETDEAVGLVHRSVGLDAHCILRDAAAVAQSGGAIVAGTRVDLAQSITHGATIGRGRNTVKKRACVGSLIRP
jgi:hypothetical protein